MHNNMLPKALVSLLLTVGLLMSITGCNASAPATPPTSAPKPTATAAPMVWKLQEVQPSVHILAKASDRFASYVKDSTGGRLEVKVYYQGQLYAYAEAAAAVAKGDLEMTRGAGSVYALVDAHDTAQPYAMPTYESTERAFNGGLRQILVREGLAKDVMVLRTGPFYGMTRLYTKKPISKLEDLKGLKVRTLGKTCTIMLQELGAVAVSVDSAELYMALQRGTVDAVLISIQLGTTNKLWEVAKYVTDIGWGLSSIDFIYANKQAFNTLPTDIQKSLQDAALKSEKELWAEMRDAEAADTKKLEQNGMVLSSLPSSDIAAARAKAPVAWADWMKRVGPAGQEMMEILKKSW